MRLTSGAFAFFQVHDAVEVAAAEFEGTAQVEVAQIERGDDECSPYSYRSGRPESGVEVSPAGEQLVRQLGADLSARFPRLTLRGVIVIGPGQCAGRAGAPRRRTRTVAALSA